jgi:holo-[acyl-carrier protein] synthase
MVILGIGIDIVENERIRTMLTRHGDRFLDRVFTDDEREYCGRMRDPAPHYAARFAAKEAVSKALGTGIGHDIEWREIEVIRSESGKPSVVLTGSGAATAERLGVTQILITLSHTEHYAVAQAMLVTTE